MTKYVKDKYMHDSEPMLNHKDIETVLKYIYEKDKELERYKNIIDELEKWLLEQLYIEAENPYKEGIIKIENPEIASILNKLKELKGE